MTENAGERVALGAPDIVIITGMSGAGRSTAAKSLEDLGWFVVDNLPPALITTMVDLGARARGEITRIAVVMDVRSRAFTTDLAAVIRELDGRGYDASADTDDNGLARLALVGAGRFQLRAVSRAGLRGAAEVELAEGGDLVSVVIVVSSEER